MKAIILVLSPKECMNLLSGNLSILVRKLFPKDYVGWVYIYCTKSRPYLVRGNGLADYLAKEYDKNYIPEPKKFEIYNFEDDGYSAEFYDFFNGKVIARFWCDKVEEIENTYDEFRWGEEDYNTETLNPDVLYEKSCLSFEEMDKYLKGNYGYAIHITNLEIFDKPKEISEFKHLVKYKNCSNCPYNHENMDGDICSKCEELKPLTRAPRSGWSYIEI